jgi:hypothetical protein
VDQDWLLDYSGVDDAEGKAQWMKMEIANLDCVAVKPFIDISINHPAQRFVNTKTNPRDKQDNSYREDSNERCPSSAYHGILIVIADLIQFHPLVSNGHATCYRIACILNSESFRNR